MNFEERMKKDLIKCPYCGNEHRIDKSCTCKEAKAENEEQQRKREEDKREEEQNKIDKRMRRAEVNEHFLRASHNDAKDLAQKMISGTSFYLFGESMSGKTHLGCAVLREIASEDASKSILFVGASKYLLLPYSEKQEAVKRYGNVDFLMFDGLEPSPVNAYTIANLRQLVDERYNANKPTLYTSIYSFDKLFSILGGCEVDKEVVKALKAKMRANCEGFRVKGHSENV